MKEPISPYLISYTKLDWELGDDKWAEFVDKCIETHTSIYQKLRLDNNN